MGKKGYNWKARNVAEVEIDNSSLKKVTLDFAHRLENYDECNALVLPSKKRKTKNKDKKVTITRILSKKKRKQLEKVINKKQKKVQRAELLEELAKVQVSENELKQYVSLAAHQTKGLKRHFLESETNNIISKDADDKETEVINSIKGSKKRRIALLTTDHTQNTVSDPNVLGLNESSDSEEEYSSNESIENEVSENKNENNDETKEKLVNEDTSVNISPESNITQVPESQKMEIQNFPKRSVLVDEERKPAVFVTVNREPKIQEARLKLPILAEEQIIMEAINDNLVVVITGETGSGKTTQVPQFLYEAGYAKEKLIGVTEPRRVAAMSMSKRVAEEMNLSSEEVSYLIRFEGNVTPNTRIKFMTDGVLLKEIQTDFLLTKYSVIILDEAHERSVHTDILIGLLSRIVPLRNKRKDPLKLIIMSATLRVEDFVGNTKLFKGLSPPVINVDSRQFPVTIHFNKRTNEDYVTEALRKTIKIHTRLPEGGILIFLTGQQEVNTVVRKLRKAFPYKKKKWTSKKDNTNMLKENVKDGNDDNESNCSEEDHNLEKVMRRLKQNKSKRNSELPNISLDQYSAVPTDDTQGDLLDDLELNDNDDENGFDDDEDEDECALYLDGTSNAQPLWVLPLYSLLPSYKQAKVFEEPPEGCRLCVVSTNVAETSLTIPNVKYVVDSGRCKTRIYDKVTGVSTFHVCYTSKAAADQRSGRAGRTSPGHCYRLYSSAVFNDQFEQFSEPEIRRKPVDDLLLQMKVMNIDKVVNFPFPTSPDITQLMSAENRLRVLGALEEVPSMKQDKFSAKVTPLGRSIAAFPVAPRYGKMLALSHQHDLLQYTVCLVAALSVQELLIEGPSEQSEGNLKNKWLQIRRKWAGTGNSLLLGDPMVLLRAVGAAEHASVHGKLTTFCEQNGLRHKAIVEVRKLRQQLTNEIMINISDLNLIVDSEMSPPTEVQAKLLQQIVLAGMADQVARKVSPDECKDEKERRKCKYAYKTLEMEEPVFMHSSSVLRKTNPEWVVYQELFETNKVYMRGITAIQPEWLPKFVPSLCQLKKSTLESVLRKKDDFVSGTFGRTGWELPLMKLENVCTENITR
ncbi:probable ATP-dependent RNA helicase kurz [Orussus abietinus]|uniref:probable ATP-dependent RNA helicase kurz n=1 Tax=Orussus abietinus TaxID=222816 RepID=UPI000626C237|nr:probable ATP-dependent RNA helicase kurz [Orussus abietinus]